MEFEDKHSKQNSLSIGFNNEFFFKQIKFDCCQGYKLYIRVQKCNYFDLGTHAWAWKEYA